MKKLFILFAFVLLVPVLAQAQTLEQQIKPYGIDLQDLDTALSEDQSLANETILSYCSNSVISLTTHFVCLKHGNTPVKYAVVTKEDSNIWQVLQVINEEGVLIISDNNVIMIEGDFSKDSVYKGSDFSNNRYLLKFIGNYQYINTLGSSATVTKFKLIQKLQLY